MLRLIDAQARETITVNGSRITIRLLTGLVRAQIRLLFQSQDGESKWAANMSDLVPLVATGIVAFEDYPGEPADILNRIAEPGDFLAVLNAVMAFSQVSETEGKNSNCSSDGSTPKPASDEFADSAGPATVSDSGR